jgi:1-acyl-sn-glycerol-3-phosphate acyltransferase
MEPVFRSLEIVGRTIVRATGTRIDYQGLENIPATGGAVIAINHTSYVDFLPAALAAMYRGRRMRFMIKSEMQKIKPVNYLIRHSGAIPVDRAAGGSAYSAAVDQLRAGEIIGMYPEATISRSFELKEFKTGAARMAIDARVPIVPLIVWGAQRIWTKDHPKQLGRNKIPITVAVGRPMDVAEPVDRVMADLRAEMTEILHRVQDEYPHPAGAHWVPHRLGGTAPTPHEARVREEAERAERARRQTENG